MTFLLTKVMLMMMKNDILMLSLKHPLRRRKIPRVAILIEL